MKQMRWYLLITMVLIALSTIFHFLQIEIFHKTEDTFFYLLQDIAFIPVCPREILTTFPAISEGPSPALTSNGSLT